MECYVHFADFVKWDFEPVRRGFVEAYQVERQVYFVQRSIDARPMLAAASGSSGSFDSSAGMPAGWRRVVLVLSCWPVKSHA